MVVLKRIKGATLMETLVATVLIVVVFMMASLILEATFTARINGNTEPLTEKFHTLEYLYNKGNIAVPYFEEWEAWEIEMTSTSMEGVDMIVLQAKNRLSQKEMKTYLLQQDEGN